MTSESSHTSIVPPELTTCSADYTRGANCDRKAPGYYVRPLFPITTTDPNRTQSGIEILWMDDTWPLILVPIVTGFLGVSVILFLTAWVGGARRWARKLHIVRSPL